jgi:TPR repeat protein
MYNLGYLYAKSIAPPNIEEARRWLQRAADTGHTASMYTLGFLLPSSM